jgi:hypothetical protein
MRRVTGALACFAGLMLCATSALSHDCRVLGNSNLKGHYEGDCDERTERAHGQGEAKGRDAYVGSFVKGKPGGSGTYTWANGAQLVGLFKDGKAHGAGVFTTAMGVRYEGNFVDGRIEGLKVPDCPATAGPVDC